MNLTANVYLPLKAITYFLLKYREEINQFKLTFPLFPSLKHVNTNIKIRNLPADDRPREKLLQFGKETLTNAELLAILINAGSQRFSALQVGQLILSQCESELNILGKLNVKELMKFEGIGEAKAIRIVAAFELGKRRSNAPFIGRPQINSSQDAYQLLSPDLSDLRKERFQILMLNRNNRMIKKHTISDGGISGTVVDPKVIYKAALDHEACGIILSHNHPSGNLKPSQADIKITKQIVASGKLLDISVLDHLIISAKGYYSFADEGMI